MNRLGVMLDVGASALVVALSLVHTFAFGQILIGEMTPGEVWFAGAGAAMFFTGAMNAVRATAKVPVSLSLLCAFAAAAMIALVLCYAAASSDFGAWQVFVQLGLYGILLSFSLRQVFGDIGRKGVV